MTGIAHPGFANPVRDSQEAFRAVLDAMARPGRVHRVSVPAMPPTPLGRAAAAVLLTLVDAETPLWLDPDAEPARDWLLFHCGSPIVPALAAQFALALQPVPLTAFSAGTDEEPESSATLILQMEAFGEGPRLNLSGPGLAAPAVLQVRGLPPGFAAEWSRNRALFPRGIDVVLCAGDQLAALPRTVRIEEA